MRFAACEHCGVYLTPGHIVQSMTIPNSSNYMAVILRCPQCKDSTKIVFEKKVLEEAQAIYDETVGLFDDMLQQAHGEVMEADGIEYLQEIWSKEPPRIEELRGKCKCATCMKKWYINA